MLVCYSLITREEFTKDTVMSGCFDDKLASDVGITWDHPIKIIGRHFWRSRGKLVSVPWRQAKDTAQLEPLMTSPQFCTPRTPVAIARCDIVPMGSIGIEKIT